MKTLIVEDHFISRQLLHRMLNRFGDCDVAVDGLEALEAFECAHKAESPYDLMCLDIMMPNLDGREVLRKIRRMEDEWGIKDRDGVKIIMTTALDDTENRLSSFQEGCEAYLVKPIDREKLNFTLKELGLKISPKNW